MGFAEDEASAQTSRPIEYYDVALSTGQTFRLAAGNRDLQIGSVVYKATPIERSDLIAPNLDGSAKDIELSLPVDHAIVSRWLRSGVPPRQTIVTAWRKQERSGVSEQQWVGLVTAITCSGNVAKLSIPARIANNVQRYLPTVTTAPTCPYILYDEMCQVDRTLFKVATTAIIVDGRDIRVDMGDPAKIGLATPWTKGGELVHVPTGERMTIVAQADVSPGFSTVTVLSMQLPLPDLKTGDAVEVYAGCDHTVSTCKDKFNIVARFGGYPYAPSTNPFVPGSSGIKVNT